MRRSAARVLTGFLLALTLAVSSITLALARGQSHGLHQVVICAGAGLATVTLDADGNPAGPPLPCADCIAGMVAALPAPDAGAANAPRAARRLGLRPDRPRADRTSLARGARAPPSRV